MREPIYLDSHATTPVDPRVLEAMLPYFRGDFGNPASRNHAFGWRAEKAVAKGREQIAELIGCSPRELVFTSGATESNNLALKGAARACQGKRDHLISVATEHKAVLDPLERLRKQGFRVTLLPVEPDGLLDLDRLRDAVDERTLLVSVMAANNEIGVLQPKREIGRIVRQAGAIFHVDAAQALGKAPIDVEAEQIDLLSATAHKLYGPKGCGILYVRRRGRRIEIEPQMDGGGHERGMRSGTLNAPSIVGFGQACAICRNEMDEEAERLRALRDRLFEGLTGLGGVRLNGAAEPRLAHNLNVSFDGVDGESMLMGLNDIAVSSGSACTSAEPKPSHVLRALGVPREAGARLAAIRATSLHNGERDRLRDREDRDGSPQTQEIRLTRIRLHFVVAECILPVMSPRLLPVLAIVLGAFAPTARTALLSDPGFELALTGTQTSNSAWVLTVNFPDTVEGAAEFREGFAAQSGNMGVWFRSFEGMQAPGDPPANAELMQMIAAVPGTYDLTFWANHETNFLATAAFVELSTDAGDITSFDILATPAGLGYQQHSILNFVAGPGTTKLTVRAVMVDGLIAQANPQSLLMDNFILTGPSAVPEPGSVGLLLGGLLAVGWLRRNKAA